MEVNGNMKETEKSNRTYLQKKKKEKKEKRIIITVNYNSVNPLLNHRKIMKRSLKLHIYLGNNGIISNKRCRHHGARVVCATNPPEVN